MIIIIVRRRRRVAHRNNENHDQNVERVNIQNILRRCPTVKFTPNLKFLGEPICSIDILEFNQGEMVTLTPCEHIFHPVCLIMWMNASVNANEKKCPNCKYSLSDRNFRYY